MAQESLIDQALRIVADNPADIVDGIPLSPEQALVWGIYVRVQGQNRGLSAGGIERAVQDAKRAGISAEEIEAAIAAAGEP